MANSCVSKGRWMFEVTLFTEGVQQIGWSTLNCKFTNEEGVGKVLLYPTPLHMVMR